MNWADYIIIAVLVLSVLVGLWRGLVSEVMALACWFLAFWLAWMFGGNVAELFGDAVPVPSVRLMLGYGLCLVTALIAGSILTFLLRKLVQGSGLSGSDRLLGMVFGLVRGLVLVSLVVLLMRFTPFPADPWWSESSLLPGFENAAQSLDDKLPDPIARYLNPAVESLPVHDPASASSESPVTL